MKRLRHYFPNYLLTILLVFSISALSVLMFVSNCLLSSSFYINSAEKHDVYRRTADYTEDYFEKSYAVSGIPSEIYMNGLDEKIVKQAVDGKITAFFDYVTGKTETINKTEIDFSELEKNVSDFFDEFAKEKNVEINDSFKSQLDKTIKTAESEIESFTNVFMFDYMEKAGIPQKLRAVYPYVSPAKYAFGIAAAIIILLLVIINKKRLSSFIYWLSVSGLCSSVLLLIPCIVIKSTDYFSRLIMRTDYIYAAVTGVLNDSVNSFYNSQLIILAISAGLMITYIFVSIISRKKEK